MEQKCTIQLPKTHIYIHHTAFTILYTNNQSGTSSAAKSNTWDSKRLSRNDPLSTLPARREKKTQMWNPAALLNTFLKINTEKKEKKTLSVVLEILFMFLIQCVKKVSAVLHPLSAHGCSSLSWVISYIPLLDWVCLNNRHKLPNSHYLLQGGLFTIWIFHCWMTGFE